MVTHPIFANNFSKNFWWAVVSGGVFTAVVFIVLFSLLCLQAKTDAGGYDDEDGNFSIRNLVKSDELSRLLKESLADELEAQATAILSSKMNAKAAAANSGTTPSGNGIVSPPAGSGTAIPGAPDKKSKSSAKSKGGVYMRYQKSILNRGNHVLVERLILIKESMQIRTEEIGRKLRYFVDTALGKDKMLNKEKFKRDTVLKIWIIRLTQKNKKRKKRNEIQISK
jgi:hypothetical protein